jgi:predicted kinase
MPKLTVLMGAPGAGKSTYASRMGTVVTNDRDMRQSPGAVLHDSYRRINDLLAAGKDVVFDTTGANPAVRRAALSIAQKHGATTALTVLDTPLQTCLDAQRGRPRKVDAREVERLHREIERQIPGLKTEGFNSVRVTRNRR